MAYSSVAITQGSGTSIAVDTVGGLDLQVVKLDVGVSGSSTPLVLTGNGGLPVDILHSATLVVNNPTAGNLKVDASGVAVPVTDNSGSFTVDAPVGTPVFVRLSDGSAAITTLPVSGGVTATQGTAAALAGYWPIAITDGTSIVGISTVSAVKALKVDVVQTVGIGALADLTTLGSVDAIGGLYNDSPSDPTSGQLAAIRITQKRGLHVNLRAAAGTEIGTSGAPIRTDPTGTTKQPTNLFDNAGNAYTDANPLSIQIAQNRTRVTHSATLSASQTGTTIWTPSSGKRIFITKVILAITVTGTLTMFSQSNSEANLLLDGTQATGNREIDFSAAPWVATATNDILKWTTGTGTVGVVTLHGYEAT